MKPRGARKPSAFCFSCKDFLAPKRMSVNLAEVIQTKHVITFGLVVLGTNGARVSYCRAMVKHRTVEYSVPVCLLEAKGLTISTLAYEFLETVALLAFRSTRKNGIDPLVPP